MTAEYRIADVIARSFRPKPNYTVCDWADKTVYLDGKATPKPGYYDTTKTPWVRRFVEASQDPTVREVIAPKSSRSGFTEAFLNIVRYMPEHHPGHVCLVMQSASKAKEMVPKRLHTTLKSCCEPYLTGNRDDFTLQLMKLTNMDITVVGSGTDTWGTETWYRLIGLDEYDSHDQTEQETNADLARSRIRDVPGATLYIFGKCKLKHGPLHSEYLGGTQERYLVPCPKCEAEIELCENGLDFGHLKKMDGNYNMAEVLIETRYKCPACKALLPEDQKRPMVNAGRYVPAPVDIRDREKKEKEERQFFDPRHSTREGGKDFRTAFPGRVSLRISDFYCLHDDLTWGHMAQKIIEASKSPQKRKSLVIDHFGTGWGETAAEIKETDVMRCRGKYLRGELPFKPLIFSCQVDRQGDRVKYVKTAFNETGEMFVIDWGELLGDEDLDLALDKLHPVKDSTEEFAVEHGFGLYDSGFEEAAVFDYCVSRDYRLHPSKGAKNVDSIAFAEQKFKTHRGARVYWYIYNDHKVKDALYSYKIRRRKAPLVWLPENTDADFMAELMAETKILEKDKFGFIKEKLKNIGDKNDYGDCVKKGLIVWHLAEAGGIINERLGIDEEEETED